MHFREFRDPILVEELRKTNPPQDVQTLMARAAERHVEELIAGPVYVPVPVFFLVTGMRVDIRISADSRVLGITAVLFAAAALGKRACGLAVGKNVNRWIAGGAMIARGECNCSERPGPGAWRDLKGDLHRRGRRCHPDKPFGPDSFELLAQAVRHSSLAPV